MFICQICKKRPATIHLTDIHNNVMKEVHICEVCAGEKGFNFQGASNLPQLLGLAAKKGAQPAAPTPTPAQPRAKQPEDDLVCPECGSAWSQFNERGRLGCPNDYEAFGSRLRRLVAEQIAPHAGERDVFHVGKRPGPRREEDRRIQAIRGLEKRLRQAVAEENYEVAAALKAELDGWREKGAKADDER